jgi:hypothetical protein
MMSSGFDMHDVSAAVSELDWIGGNLEEYFPHESMEVNEAGEIIITQAWGFDDTNYS